jgi:putative salt-induced outer membrane protein YdiY
MMTQRHPTSNGMRPGRVVAGLLAGALAPVALARGPAVHASVLDDLNLDLDLVGAVDPVAPAALQDAAEPPPKEWKSSFTLAAGASAGNTDSQNLAVILKSVRETPSDVTTLDAGYTYGAQDGDRSSNKATGGIRHDWLLPDSPWFLFAQGRADYDEFQSWEYRLSAHGGAGYELIKSEKFDLTARFGAGVNKEFNSLDEDLKPEALLGLDMRWQITEKQSLVAGSTLYPDLGDLSESRLVSFADWKVLVDEESNMNLYVGIQDEYYSRTDEGIRHNDFRVVAGVQFEF